MTSTRRNRNPFAILTLILSALVLALAVGFIMELKKDVEEPVDEHAGQVYIYDGFDWIWMTPLEGVPVNELTEEKFSSASGQITFVGEGYEVLRGIDVSEHQHGIDWSQVAVAGIDYAYIRLGWRGYTEGGLFEDAYFNENIIGATKAGLEVGVYFFSQAISVQEAMEEADFVLARIAEHNVTLPIVFDWEKVEDETARSHGMTMDGRTACARAFCETVKNAGYTPCVYFNRNLGYYGYDLRRLSDYEFWFSLPESGFPNFYYACDMWQYSFTETVPGINEPTDMNLRFIKLPSATQNDAGLD